MLCKGRFGSLDSLYTDIFDSHENLNIIGVGETDDTEIDDMVEGRILPWVIDNNTYNIWDNWEIINRDLIFLDKDGKFSYKINLTNKLNGSLIVSTIHELLSND